MIGGPALGVMEAIAAGYVSSAYKNAIAYGVTIVVLMLIAIPRMPTGGGAPPRHARITMLGALGISLGSERTARIAGAVALSLGMLLLPFAFDDYTANVLTLALVYAVAALGLQLVIGFGGAIIVGFAAFVGIGAYASAIAATKFLLPFPVPLFIGAALAGLTGLIFGHASTPAHYCAIATLGFGEICHLVSWTGRRLLTNVRNFRISQAADCRYEDRNRSPVLFSCATILAVVYVALRRLVSSRYGRALISARETSWQLLSMGVDVRGCRTLPSR